MYSKPVDSALYSSITPPLPHTTSTVNVNNIHLPSSDIDTSSNITTSLPYDKDYCNKRSPIIVPSLCTVSKTISETEFPTYSSSLTYSVPPLTTACTTTVIVSPNHSALLYESSVFSSNCSQNVFILKTGSSVEEMNSENDHLSTSSSSSLSKHSNRQNDSRPNSYNTSSVNSCSSLSPVYHHNSFKAIDHTNVDMSDSCSTVICNLTTPFMITDSLNLVSIESSDNSTITTTDSIMNIASSSTGLSTDTYTSLGNLPLTDSSLVCRSRSYLPTHIMDSLDFTDLTQKLVPLLQLLQLQRRQQQY
ncbi:unnamed protein product [Schistosoma turkestanicum]|nr:unnamed protein product [Schistosoma turkestanicum]